LSPVATAGLTRYVLKNMRVLFKIAIYAIATLAVSYLFIQVGSEIILQGAMVVLDINERSMLEAHSGVTFITLSALIHEVIIGSMCGWEFAGWIERINT